ncbi:MAG: hypothetical protein KY455_01045 [Euryarchaeota archaeon]|nr:hypothetical protein [Euryarchaeota archaeon]
MPTGPDLLVTYDPQRHNRAQQDMKAVLRRAEAEYEFIPNDIPGVAQIRVDQDPKTLVKALREYCREDPSMFGSTYRWIPVEAWTAATTEAVEELATAMDDRISDDETWGIQVKTHGSRLHSAEVVKEAERHIDHPKVDLDGPQKQCRFDIVGDHIAASVLAPDERLNVNDFRGQQVAASGRSS